jgi:hydroxymethylglutaryl-CoA reductase
MKTISGFSKLSKKDKINWLSHQFAGLEKQLVESLTQFWLQDENLQKRFDEFSENTLTNFNLPFGLAPNFLINGRVYSVPMVIEESSVVAAASLGAKFWLERGGFRTSVISTQKVGHVHFKWNGSKDKLNLFFDSKKDVFLKSLSPLIANMEKRGGGITDISLIDMTSKIENYYQLKIQAQTCDAMGANFINSLLEELARIFKAAVSQNQQFEDHERDVQIIMCILSNYTPDCLVEAVVECKIEELGVFSGEMSPEVFAERFATAVRIAQVDPSRAVTHNKGIMNGIDAVVLATGNDFRATEACVHAYAAKSGQYTSLSKVDLSDGVFRFSLKLPLAVGTIGGLTSLHPLAKTSLAILEHPSSEELMQIMAAVGLAQNFSALKSLVTTGIQKGHMKLHLLNILAQFNAGVEEVEKAKTFFSDKVVSYNGVRDFIQSIRH